MRGYSAPMTSSGAPATSPLQPLQLIVASFLGTIPMLGIVMVIIAGLEDYPSPAVAGGLFVLNVLAFALAEAIGYRTVALAPGTSPEEARQAGLAALQTTTMLRLAITEAPAILSLVAAFVFLPETAWTYIVGAVWALVSVAWHGWPSSRVVRKVEASLDREGGRSHLSEALGRPDRSHGIREY